MTKSILRQVRAILEANELAASDTATGVALRFDSAIVSIAVSEFGSQRLIQIRANVLSAVPKENAGLILHEINRLNCESVFGKWSFYPNERVVALEYDLLGDFLQEAELMTALQMTARLADHYDDQLQQRFGGLRAIDH
jgi:hypothetical protein